MRRRTHIWFEIDVDGKPFLVKGDPEMSERTREALAALARAVRAMTPEDWAKLEAKQKRECDGTAD